MARRVGTAATCVLTVWASLATSCGDQPLPARAANTLRLELGGDRPELRAVLTEVARRTAADRPADGGRPEVDPLPRLSAEQGARRLPRYARLRQGETLSELAARTLGSGPRWREIAELNNIANPAAVPANSRLLLPPE